jgi:hypothetical protein
MFGSSGGMPISRANFLCNDCGASLSLRRVKTDRGSEIKWKPEGESQTALSESCVARRRASDEAFHQTIRNLDEALREQLAAQGQLSRN